VAVSINKNWLILAAAIALGGAAFFLSDQAIKGRMTQLEEDARRGRTLVEVVVARKNLLAGEIIDKASVAVREVPAEFVNNAVVLPANFKSIDGQALQVSVAKGETILINYTASRGGAVFSANVKDGRRALTIEVDEISSFSGMLRPGDKIDILLTAKPPEKGTIVGPQALDVTFPMLSNVEVLATGQASRGKEAAGEANARAFSHITLNVTPLEATRIVAAKAGGRLTAVLRSTADKLDNPSRAITVNDVVGYGSPASEIIKRDVSYIIGGSGSAAAKVTNSPLLDSIMKDPAARANAEKLIQGVAVPPVSGKVGAPPSAAK
jgi:pilus assembly protein CpaB